MPYKSKAQMRKFFAMESKGELPKGTAKEWAHHTPDIKKLPDHVEKTAMNINLQGLGARIRARLANAVPKALTKTPARTAATAGVAATGAGIAGKALYDAAQGGGNAAVPPRVEGAQEAFQGMFGKMDTPATRSPAAAPSASGTTQAPGTLSGRRSLSTGAKVGLVGTLGAAAGFGAGALMGRRGKKKPAGNLGKSTMPDSSMTKAAFSDMQLLGAGAAAFPLVGGAYGAIQGARKAPRGKRLVGAGHGALRGVGGGLGAMLGLSAGTLGGLSAGAALENHGHPLAGELTSRVSALGGALGGAHLGSAAVDGLLNTDDEDEGQSYKYGSDGRTSFSRYASRTG